MTPGLMGFLIGLIITAALALNLTLSRLARRRGSPNFAVPEFTPRQQKPRAITRIHKDNLTWEI